MKKKNLFLLNNKAFSVVGVLAASVIGLIVVAGLTQLTSNISVDVQRLKTMANSLQLSRRLDNFFNTNCEARIKNTVGSSNLDNLFKGNASSLPRVEVLKDEKGSEHFKLTEDNIKNAYNLKGVSKFSFKCAGSSCNCSGSTNTCEWKLILSTTVFNNNLPTFTNLNEVHLSITYMPDESNKKDSDRFTCEGEVISNNNNNNNNNKDDDDDSNSKSGIFVITGNDFKLISSEEEDSSKEVWATTEPSSERDFEAGRGNTFFGYRAGKGNQVSIRDSYKSSDKKSSNRYNAFFGAEAGYNEGSVNAGGYNSFFGYKAGSKNTRGEGNTYIGAYSGMSNTTSGFNTYVGYKAGQNFTSTGNTFVGNEAGGVGANSSGNNNSFFGASAGKNNSSGRSNVFIGYEAGSESTSSFHNTFVGYQSGKSNTGSHNAFLELR